MTRSAEAADRSPHVAVADPARLLARDTPYRAKLDHAELFIPSWFATRDGHYDVILHFHGMGRLQEHNLETAHINAVVVSVNHGVGTDAYGKAFADPRAFVKLLAAAHEEMIRSGRAPGAELGRIALSAWSAGFVCVSKILGDPTNGARIDAVLLADGFFTSYLDAKKHVINAAPLERFANLANAASKGDKLFGITHTAIPTSGYPSVEDTVAKLLDMVSSQRVPVEGSQAIGPGSMRETYAVDQGSFHVKGYAGVLAGDHIKQVQAMGETLWPYLKDRWDPSSPEKDSTAEGKP